MAYISTVGRDPPPNRLEHNAPAPSPSSCRRRSGPASRSLRDRRTGTTHAQPAPVIEEARRSGTAAMTATASAASVPPCPTVARDPRSYADDNCWPGAVYARRPAPRSTPRWAGTVIRTPAEPEDLPPRGRQRDEGDDGLHRRHLPRRVGLDTRRSVVFCDGIFRFDYALDALPNERTLRKLFIAGAVLVERRVTAPRHPAPGDRGRLGCAGSGRPGRSVAADALTRPPRTRPRASSGPRCCRGAVCHQSPRRPAFDSAASILKHFADCCA